MKKLIARIHVLLLTLMVALIASSSAFATATIVIQNTDGANVGFNDPTPAAPVAGNPGTTVGQQRLLAFQRAADIWGATLNSNQTITVRANWQGLPCDADTGVLGSAGSTGMQMNFVGAPFAGTWYSIAQANSLSNSDLNFGTAEISARFNVNVGTSGCLTMSHWYYGFDTAQAPGRINLVAVLLHELAHGLGFQSFTDEENGAQFGGFPSIYDRFLLDNTTGKTWVQMTDAERVASAINDNNLVWNGPQVVGDAASVLNGGKDPMGRPRIWAINPVDPGSSISHWDIDLSPNQLMEPNINSNLSHSVSPPQDLTNSLLKDIGWPTVLGPPPSPTPTPSPPPNDNLANAQSIFGCSGTVAGTNVAATRETGEPNHSPDGFGGTHSVWYQWQSPSNSTVTITTAGSNYDTVLGVYTGTAVGSLTLIARNDDVVSGTVSSRVVFPSNAGTIYRIAVDGYDNNDDGGDIGSITLNWSATSCSTASSASFSSATFSVAEGVDGTGIGFEGTGFRTITVQRTGSLAVPATVDYSTSNGSAEARKDYAQSAGTLRFGQNESSKTFIVFITDDVFFETPETVNLTLSNGVDMTVGATPTTVLTINSNDGATGLNPVDPASFNTAFFVRQHYVDFFTREPDIPGMNFWKDQIDSCTDEPCREIRRINVSGAFFLSIEFQQTGYLVYRTFTTAFGPTRIGTFVPLTLAEFVPDVQRIGLGVVIGMPGADALLEANKQAYFNEFVTRQQFLTPYPLSLTPGQFVDALNANALALSQAERDALVADLTAGTKTRAQVLRAVAEDSTLVTAHFNKAFVLMQYFGYLRRNPNDLPDSNFDGYNFWLNKLNSFNGNFVNAEMVKAFIISGEYKQRFGP
ncbi:MAG: hypothetical protein ND895_18595 [Pyrinomonadaceae bacterium]|nr:hypothetical protein [Pyrinomonadaceae bacterium]